MLATPKYKDQQLVDLLKKRDDEAFAFLYDRYSPPLYGIMLKITGSEEKAQEAMQDAFIKIRKNISSYERTKGKLFAWMLSIAKSSAIEMKHSMPGNASPISQPVISVTNVSRKTNGADIKYPNLEAVMKKMKTEEVALIDSIYLKGSSLQDVSKEYQIQPDMVKTQIRSAISKLKEAISEKA